ncbi:hypothetical protein Misp01_70370 [Microtetraspora sp. NBRC 13810]|uniref:hypothetical protein n=1 Tax=Microtetraspora sp. NBRC 13810 TaxID=3030990 RepID=UPI0024A5AB05|nr:hypothetical protein [Microtetraspora sp. NBRC 13810]GLW11909.1 hypothetical protein Misp01_70370 [Microtetraspora sp. NBRC 13810]
MDALARSLTRSFFGVTALALVLLVSSCGGDDGTAAAAPAQPGAGGDSRAAFAQCLREHGVTLPTARPSGAPSARPGGGPSGGPGGGFGAGRSLSPEMGRAMQACASLRPSGGPGRMGGRRMDDSAFQAFRTCMQDNGAKLPEGRGAARPDESDPAVAKALKKCRPLLPTPAPAPSS